MKRQVWVVAQVKDSGWELGGVYTSEERARRACTEPVDTYWSVPLNEFLGRDTVAPPNQRFPVTERSGA